MDPDSGPLEFQWIVQVPEGTDAFANRVSFCA